MTLNGTDFQINEPKPFWPGWKSFKFNGPGVCYKVALCICTGDIVWINRPFPCGQWSDLKIFWHALMSELEAGKMVEADLEYEGEKFHINEVNIFLSESGQEQKYLVRAHHETVNKRLKQWNCLHRVFQHKLRMHGPLFKVWLQLHSLQLKMESHCLMLNTMILFILQSCSDKNSSLTFHMNTSSKHITSFKVKFYNPL